MKDSYRYVLIETYVAHGEQSKHEVRARPLARQGLSTSMRVDCSSCMRATHPPGTIFKVVAKIKDTPGAPHVYTSWQWDYDVVSTAEAKSFVRRGQWAAPPPKKKVLIQECRMDFKAKHDGLERTPWYLFARHLPEREGYYEVRPWTGAPDTRCEWRDDGWWASERIAHRLQVYEWRGITEKAYRLANSRLGKRSVDA